MDSGFKKRHRVNPRTTANLLSLITFWYVCELCRCITSGNESMKTYCFVFACVKC